MITRGRLIAFILSVLAVGCAAAGLSACSTSQPSAVRPPTLTPSQGPATTTTRSPSPSPSGAGDAAWARVPKKARAHTYAAAQAFAEFYTEQVNRAWQWADADLIRPYATDHCKTCRNYEDTAEDMADRNERYDGPALIIEAAAWQPESTPAHVLVNVLAIQAARNIVTSDGSLIRKIDEEPGALQLTIDWVSGKWMVTKSQLVQVVQ